VVKIKKKISDLKETDIIDKRQALRRRIERWQDVQVIYMPAVSQLHTRSHSSTTSTSSDRFSRPELIPLYLPSSLPPTSHSSPSDGLFETEKRLRVAQADDALAELRKLLRITMGLWDYKHTQLGPSQGAGTRARTMIGRFRDKVNRCADRYRAAHSALKILDPNGDWVHRLLELTAADVKPPRRDDKDDKDKEKRVTEGQHILSWIWIVQRGDSAVEASEEEIGDSKLPYNLFPYFCTYGGLQGLRVEWAKARARALRWGEEVELLDEEMRRILCFCDWKAAWWMRLGTARPDCEGPLREGLTAYAAKQAHIQHEMAACFADQWYPELVRSGVTPDWPPHYLSNRDVCVVDETPAEPDYRDDDDDDVLLDGDLFE
jgi:hypothetical protein